MVLTVLFVSGTAFGIFPIMTSAKATSLRYTAHMLASLVIPLHRVTRSVGYYHITIALIDEVLYSIFRLNEPMKQQFVQNVVDQARSEFDLNSLLDPSGSSGRCGDMDPCNNKVRTSMRSFLLSPLDEFHSMGHVLLLLDIQDVLHLEPICR